MKYAELQITSHFSFLRGVSSAEELFSAAALLKIDALGIVGAGAGWFTSRCGTVPFGLAGMFDAPEPVVVAGVVTAGRLVIEAVSPTRRSSKGGNITRRQGV